MKCSCGKQLNKGKTIFGSPEDYWECNECGFDCCSIPCECPANACQLIKIDAVKHGGMSKHAFRKAMGEQLTKELEEELKEYL